MAKMSQRPGVLACLVLATAVACNRQPDDTADTASAITESRPDTWVATSVEAALYGTDDVRGSDIDVDVTDGVVTLSGSVPNETARERAIAAARGVDGATRVDDRLTVTPDRQVAAQPRTAADQEPAATSAADTDDRNPAWITTKIQAQYFANPEVKPWNIDVTTRPNGVVELRGEVEEAADRTEAVRIARETEGVVRVDNQLRVRGEDQRDDRGTDLAVNRIGEDAWVTAQIQSKYFLDDDVKSMDIDVTTVGGVVTLRGSVDNASERRQALALARNTEGVRDVRDELRVGTQAADAQARAEDDGTGDVRGTSGSGVASAVDDAWITTKVQSQYFLDPEVKGHEIDVDTRGGVVTLSGSVASEMRKNLAGQIARETEGVSRVVNQLSVAPAD